VAWSRVELFGQMRAEPAGRRALDPAGAHLRSPSLYRVRQGVYGLVPAVLAQDVQVAELDRWVHPCDRGGGDRQP